MKKVIWTPKVYDFKGKSPTRWCELGSHIFINYKSNPPTKICKYCKKEEKINERDNIIT